MDISNNDNTLHEFINDFAESKLSKPELQAFSELMEQNPEVRKMSYAGMIIHNKFRTSDKIRAKKGFEQRMAARFAEEMKREVVEENIELNSVNAD